MEIAPYLNFNGNAPRRSRVYEKVLGGTITMKQTHGESADEGPGVEGLAGQGDARHDARSARKVIMGSDTPPAHFAAQGMTVSISVAEAAEGERIFKALSEAAGSTMPFGKTFWSAGFGMASIAPASPG